jgi:hypothetical protein
VTWHYYSGFLYDLARVFDMVKYLISNLSFIISFIYYKKNSAKSFSKLSLKSLFSVNIKIFLNRYLTISGLSLLYNTIPAYFKCLSSYDFSCNQPI